MNGLPIPTSVLDDSSDLKNFLKLDITGNNFPVLVGENHGPVIIDFSEKTHLLLIGWSGSGKEKVVDTMLQSMFYTYGPEDARFIIFDNTNCFYPYNGTPHVLTEIITDYMKLTSALKWTQSEVENRLKEFREKNVHNIGEFNQLEGVEKKPRIFFFINTLNSVLHDADPDFESLLADLIDRGHKAGIHLIILTDYIPRRALKISLLSNIPDRIICQLTNKEDSIAAGVSDAYKLNQNEMYLVKFQEKPRKIRMVAVRDDEITKTVKYLKSIASEIQYTEEVTVNSVSSGEKDPLFSHAAAIIKEFDRVSASLLQRRLSIGYARAARLLDQLEESGLIGPAEGSRPRKVIKKKQKKNKVIN